MQRNALRIAVAGLVMIAQLTGCRDELTTPAHPAPSAERMVGPTDGPTKNLTPAVERDLATLRAATTRFHRFAVSQEAQYTFLFMNMCMVDGSVERRGGMGYHYVNTGLLDGQVNVATPEALLYERRPNGELTLTGVEYVIPKDAWTGPGKPMLFGREFTLNGFGLWALHVWVWKENPSGLFADWNPRVSCANAGAAMPTTH